MARLVNLSPFAERSVIVQAGGFGEHQIEAVTFDARASDYPGSHHAYAPPPLQTERQTVRVDDKWLRVTLPPATEARLVLQVARHVNEPSYAQPW